MNKSIGFFASILLLLSSTAFAETASLVAVSPMSSSMSNFVPMGSDQTRVFTPSNFMGIETSHTPNYQIIVDGKTNSVQVQGDPKLLKYVKCYVDKNGILQLSYPYLWKAPFQVTIHTVRLNHLIQTGSGNVSVNYLTPQALQLDKTGSGNLSITGPITLVGFNYNGTGGIQIPQIKTTNLIMNVNTPLIMQFKGVINASEINFYGPGVLRVFWVKSRVLNVSSYGSGTLALAGVANVVNAYSHQKSHLDIRYVRAKNTFVKSYDDSSADVIAQRNLFTLASNNSNIYYYSNTPYKSRMMQESGTVLPMWNIPGAMVEFNTRGSSIWN